ncbi:muscle LIM protein Mlp84B-like [Harmonia axyridis]|uniref:muscle LIM protein Mlp84B-like n=1 Tax=Harmonia axyridis TaxID=115357 RepID=UPI001E279501|nr:muscle LIM protein Mlp84B-like [Harmonia axyridis]
MPQCAACGKKVCPEEPRITLNKVWHKCCFRCNKCNCDLNADFARVYKGEIYCHSCFKMFRKYCSFEGEDETATIEEHYDPCCSSSSHNCCRLSPTHSDDCFLCKNKRRSCRSGCHALPRELANYCNRNPVGDKRITPLCLKDHCRPCVHPVFPCQQPKSRCGFSRRKCPVISCMSRSSSCLDKAARSLSKRRECSDSCESLEKFGGCRRVCNARKSCGETRYGCQNKMHCCDNNRNHKYTGCAPCRRCGHKVYAAEIVLTSYGAYHNSCFSCYSCLKPLDATNVEEHCGEIFCRRCYKKHFGFNNYGFRNRVF